jgi:serine/threonine protein phosphatase PrpC
MGGQIQTVAWRFAGRSVRGAFHRRRRTPNQDALGWKLIGESGLVVAVADGHGSVQSFRSGIGAELAVDAAIALMADFQQRNPEKDEEAVLAAAQSIPAKLVSRWRESVAGHLSSHPLAPAEMTESNGDREASWRIYGSTILAALAAESYLLFLQLGDGDMLVVSDAGDVQRAWARDERLLGVETTSLCGPGAVADVRIAALPLGQSSPALVLIATDGYANSFREEEGFLRAGADMLEIVRSEGIEKVESGLEAWLTEASELGSGDDITVAVLCRAGEKGTDGR